MNNKLLSIDEKQLVLEKEKSIIEIDNEVSDEHYLGLKHEIFLLEKEIDEKRTLKLENIQSYEKSNSSLKIIDEKSNYLNREIQRLEDELEKSENLLLIDNNEENIDDKLNSLLEQKNKSLSIQTEKDNNRSTLIQSLTLKEATTSNLKNDLIKLYNKVSDKRSELSTITLFSENLNKRNNQIYLQII